MRLRNNKFKLLVVVLGLFLVLAGCSSNSNQNSDLAKVASLNATVDFGSNNSISIQKLTDYISADKVVMTLTHQDKDFQESQENTSVTIGTPVSFSFTSLPVGTYNVDVKAIDTVDSTDYTIYTTSQTGITIDSSENNNLGSMSLELNTWDLDVNITTSTTNFSDGIIDLKAKNISDNSLDQSATTSISSKSGSVSFTNLKPTVFDATLALSGSSAKDSNIDFTVAEDKALPGRTVTVDITVDNTVPTADVKIDTVDIAETFKKDTIQYPDLDTIKTENGSLNQTMMQTFYWEMGTGSYAWNYPGEDNLWELLEYRADKLADVGITSLWLPPANKAMSGTADVGYGAYDFWDLGEFDQKGTVRTKYGTKSQLVDALDAIHAEGMKAYYDVVFNHRMGAEATETVTLENDVTFDDGTTLSQVDAWTVFDFTGRQTYYTQDNWVDLWNDFNWNSSVFDGVDYDEVSGREEKYQFQGKTWGWMHTGSEDFLMGADVDYYNYGSNGEVYPNTNVIEEMKAWGEWIVNDIGFDGFRIDAVKHVDSTFIYEWINHVQNNSNKDLFFVGEAWISDTSKLSGYLDTVDGRASYFNSSEKSDLKVFDFPLRSLFAQMRDGGGSFDMTKLVDNDSDSDQEGLANEYGYDTRAVTFTDNHDSNRDEGGYGKTPINKYAYQAYSYILTRSYATPSVFWKDYYQYGMKDNLDELIRARRYFAYGNEHEHGNTNSSDVYCYTREGLDNVPGTGLVMMISDGTDSTSTATKTLYTARPDVTYVDITGNVSSTVTTNSSGYGDFNVYTGEGNGWSIWVPQSWPNGWNYVSQ